MIISREKEDAYLRAGYFNRRYYLQSRGSWTSTNTTGVLCYDDVVCEDECCHDMDFGMPYCCSKYMGLVYLGLMIGAGVIVAVLVIACYICMTKTERQLEAAAKLEAAKAANNHGSVTVAEASSATDQTDVESDVNPDLSLAPPAYNDVMRTFTRCHSCDVGMTSNSQHAVNLVEILMRQHSEGNQAPHCTLPPLVDVAALIARHRSEHGVYQGLPPIMSQDELNKLPSYEECTAQSQLSTNTPVDDSEIKASNQILQTLAPCLSEDNPVPQSDDVKMESHDSHFVSLGEAMQGLRRPHHHSGDEDDFQVSNQQSLPTRLPDLAAASCSENEDQSQANGTQTTEDALQNAGGDAMTARECDVTSEP